MDAPLRIALVDDHELFRGPLALALASHGFDVVIEASDARSSFPLIEQARPAVVLLDVGLPGMDGVTAARELLARSPSPKIMMLSASDVPHVVAAAFEAGVAGYALKIIPLEELVRGIHAVARGERYLSPGIAAVPKLASGPLALLSARERDVFRLITRGLSTREIAGELCISVKTVETHRERVFKKLNVHSVVQLLRFAYTNGLVEGPSPETALHKP